MTFMELKTAPHLLIFVIVYFGVMIGIGAWASKKIKSSEDYALAGRSLGPFVLMGTLLATSVGSGTITGGGKLARLQLRLLGWYPVGYPVHRFLYHLYVCIQADSKEQLFYRTADSPAEIRR
ncbi:MAG: hypothetical protein V8R18_06980 [Clostridium sp.]